MLNLPNHVKVFKYEYDRTIMSMLPGYYRNYLESEEHVITSDIEFARMYELLGILHNQIYIGSSSFLLGYYADLLGIDHESGRLARWADLSNKKTWGEFLGKKWGDFIRLGGYSDDKLRELILSKLNTRIVSSIPGLKKYVKEISGYDVEIVEFNSIYAVTVFLKEGSGSELLLEDIIEILRPLIPAHINLTISHTYLRWFEWDSIAWVWDDFDSHEYTWDDIEDKGVWSTWLS